MTSFQSYILCTSPRSGSTLLCKLLSATGRTGYPDSHFHSPSIADWMNYYDITPENNKPEPEILKQIFQAARDRGTGDTGIFGLRLQRHSFDFFIQKLRILYASGSNDHDRIQQAFGQTLFIHLTRQNKLDQAISTVKATQTGLWHQSSDGQELERLSAPQTPFYDADSIKENLKKLTDMDQCWNSWFAEEGIKPMIINYDDLSDDPLKATGEIVERLGFDSRLTIDLDIPVAKLADATNREWASRFRSEQYSRDKDY